MDQSNGRPRRPTVFDVAKTAGVSRGTVSRYVNGKPYVSETAKKSIEAAIREVGYAPNSAALSLVRQRSGNIAFIVHESHDMFFEDPNLTRMVIGANRVLSENDVQLILLIIDSDRAIRRIANSLRGGYVDGAILASVRSEDPLLTIVNDLRLPAALAGHPNVESSVPYVDVDNERGAEEITRRLVATGRRRVAMIMGPTDMPLTGARLAGFRAALGHEFDESLVIPTADWSHASGVAAMGELLHRSPDIDGVFGACDAIAIGAIDTLRAAGRSVPGDVGVVGFDDSPWATRSVPHLSTVSRSSGELGARMADMVLRQLNGEDLSNAFEVLPTRIAWRDSA